MPGLNGRQGADHQSGQKEVDDLQIRAHSGRADQKTVVEGRNVDAHHGAPERTRIREVARTGQPDADRSGQTRDGPKKEEGFDTDRLVEVQQGCVDERRGETPQHRNNRLSLHDCLRVLRPHVLRSSVFLLQKFNLSITAKVSGFYIFYISY